MRRPAPVIGSGLALAVLTTGLVVGGTTTSYALDGDDCTSINQVETERGSELTDFQAAGSPADLLHTEDAQRRVTELTGRTAGDGVTVAVLDSGVERAATLPVEPGTPAPGAVSTTTRVYYQGTMLAGVIAADPDPTTGQPIGIAPGATIFDQRIYDTGAETDDELTQVGPDSVAEGLEAIAPQVGRKGISIIVVGVDSPDSERLRDAVDLVTGKGAIIVAASAARTDAVPFRDGEDYAALTWPAGYAKAGPRGQGGNPLVVAVTTTATSGDGEELDPSSYILFSSAIDVAAPTAGAVSLGLNGLPCSVVTPTPAVAAAEVAGVLALLRTGFPRDRPQQLIARLESTASGAATFDPATPDTREGKGVIEPLEALTRPLLPDRDGRLPVSSLPEREGGPAVLPVDGPDVLASTRENAVWWGLLGGGGLIVLILLRPVLSRRRRQRPGPTTL